MRATLPWLPKGVALGATALLLVPALFLADEAAAGPPQPTGAMLPHQGPAGTVWDGVHVYIFEPGGVLRYNPTLGTVGGASSMPPTVEGSSMAWDGSHAYFFGFDEIWRYDTKTNVFTKLPQTLPTHRLGRSAVWADEEGAFYIFGGFNYAPYLATDEILRFDPQSGQNATVLAARLPFPIRESIAIWGEGVAYVFPNSFDSVVEFDPKGGTSGDGVAKPMSVTVPVELTSAVWDGQAAYLFGGYTQTSVSDQIWRFDPAVGGRFDPMHKLPSPRGSTSAAWDGQAAYIIGGSNNDPDPSSTWDILRYVPPPFLPAASAVVASSLHFDLSSHSAIWTGQVAYTFGGWTCTPTCHAVPDILKYDPSTGTFTPVAALPTARTGTSAVWDGSRYAYVFGGYTASGNAALVDILRFDTSTNQVSLAGTLPSATAATSAVWTGQSAYVFGGSPNIWGVRSSDVVQFVPGAGAATGTASVVASLPSPRSDTSAVWDGQHAYVFGGQTPANAPMDEILRFTPPGLVEPMSAKLPSPRSGTSAAWDGRHAFVFGGFAGCNPGCSFLDEIVVVFTSADDAIRMHATLPSGRDASAAVWAGKSAYVIGGFPDGTQAVNVTRVPQIRIRGPATYEATSPEGAQVSYTVTADPDLLRSPCQPGQMVFPLGHHRVSCAATDHNGVGATAVYDFDVVDTVRPQLDLTTAGTQGTNGWHRSNVKLTLSCTDASGVASRTLAIDGGAATSYTGAVTVSQQGSHTAAATCIDRASNPSSDVRTFKIDSVPPGGSTDAPDRAVGAYTVGWTASDATSGVVLVEIQEAGSTSLSPAYTTVCTATPDKAATVSGTCARNHSPGLYCYQIVVTDEAGNVFAETGPGPGDVVSSVAAVGSNCVAVG